MDHPMKIEYFTICLDKISVYINETIMSTTIKKTIKESFDFI